MEKPVTIKPGDVELKEPMEITVTVYKSPYPICAECGLEVLP